MEWLQQQASSVGVESVQLSWLELAACVNSALKEHPIPVVSKFGECWGDASSLPPARIGQLTVAARIRFLRGLVRALDGHFGLHCQFASGLNCSRFRVHMPLQGVVLCLSRPVLAQLDTCLSRFTATRSVKTSNDLARPF